MKKKLLNLAFLLGLSIASYAQDSIPKPVTDKVNYFLSGVSSYCSDVKIKFVSEKFEDKNGDGIKDRVSLYRTEGCETIPVYFIYTQNMSKEGVFTGRENVEVNNGRDSEWKEIPLNDNDW